MLRKPDTFDPVCFLYVFLSRISKAEIVKRTLLQKESFFQSSDKKATCLTPTQIKIFGNQIGHFCQISQKETFFTLSNNNNFFLISFCCFWRSAILLSQTLYLFCQVALCNQPTVVLCHWKRYRTGIFKPYNTPLWTIGFSIMTYISFGEVSKNCIRMH